MKFGLPIAEHQLEAVSTNPQCRILIVHFALKAIV